MIALTIVEDELDAVRLLRTGVRGYVVKTEEAKALIRAVKQVAAGGTYLSPRLSDFLHRAYLTGDGLEMRLTAREQQVLRLVVSGHTSREAAEMMGVTSKTIEGYRARLMGKLGVRDMAGLVRYAVRRGLIDP